VRSARAWPVAFSLLLYVAAISATAVVVAPLGFLGGFIVGFVVAACIASYVGLLSQAVHKQPIRWSDIRTGMQTRFWDVVSVLFAFWILVFVSGHLAQSFGPKAPAMAAIITLAMVVFFNVVPELLYLGNTRSFALLLDSGRFVTRNWTGWFGPNLVFALALLLPTGALKTTNAAELIITISSALSPVGWSAHAAQLFIRNPVQAYLWLPLSLLALNYVMVFRGLLFQELSRSNPRLRAFQAKLNR